MDITQKLSRHVFGASKEDNDVVLNVDIERADEDGTPLDGGNTAEQSIVQAQDIESSIDNQESITDEMQEAQGALESFLVSVESFKANGAMTPAVAQAIYVGLDAITKSRFDITTEDYAAPSLESYSALTSEAICISLEASIKEAAGSFLKSSVASIKETWNKTKGWIAEITDANQRLANRAKTLGSQVSGIKGKPKSDSVGEKFTKTVGIASGTPAQGAKNLEAFVKRALGAGTKNADRLLAKMSSKKLPAWSEVNAVLAQYGGVKDLPGKLNGYEYPKDAGQNRTIWQDFSRAVSKIKPASGTEPTNKLVTVATPAEMVAIVKSVESITATISAYNNSAGTRQKSISDAINKSWQVGWDVDTSDNPGQHNGHDIKDESAYESFYAFLAFFRAMNRIERDAVSKSTMICKSLLDYVIASAKLYDGGAEAVSAA